MADLILHHYANSPFSEKIRLILGYKSLAWKSVLVPSLMPKPDVQALTGGYRKTPILQIGADIYCDTSLICDVLEHLRPHPSLYPKPGKGLARNVAQWADTTLFWAVMAHNMSPKGAMQVFGSPELARTFGEDRRAMMIGMARLRPGDALSACKSYLRRLSDMLDGWPYLLGEQPCIADFSACHALWFTRTQTPAMAGIFEIAPAVLEWMDRMAAIGHGAMAPMSAADALRVAAEATPAPLADAVFQDDHGIALGTRVGISSESFGPESTEGELLAATRMHYTLRRVDPRAGTLHVHFPRIGYVLKALD
ncbi:MAG: glutathione S-transferase family protein [Burkholderiaceae bacterium]|nr:glutathione S-transferase family protein [Burkholderiaceae bacterium]